MQPVGQSFTDNIFHLTESTKADNKDYINQQTTASKKAIYTIMVSSNFSEYQLSW